MQFVRFEKSQVEQSIPDRLSEISRKYADRFAVCDRGQNLTYSELGTWSNRIAHAILAACDEVQEPVGILLEQGPLAIAAIIGALKAGKIYVPMEASASEANLRQILEDCQPGLIIVDSKHAALAHSLTKNSCGCLNVESIDASFASGEPGIRLSAESIAYIYYTSGTTGRPKGVFDCHRNVLHNVMRYTNNLHIGPQDRHSLIQSCSFSGTVSSMFGTLLNGATLCPFNLQYQGIDCLARWLNTEQITIFHSVPSIFDRLLSIDMEYPSLRTIRLEGDQSFKRHVRRFQQRFGTNCVLAIGLGATETGLIRQFIVTADARIAGQSVPVGYHVEDMCITLIDNDGVEVAQGEVGQIAVKSAFLAKGYWRRPQQTADAFSAVPGEPGARIYRTGDLGRLLPNGCLEYAGRVDFQAKVHGVAVNTAILENALQDHDAVEHALVMVREDSAGSEQLTGYLIPSNSSSPTVEELRKFLADSLPGVLPPSKLVFMDQFPVDRNGKIDRRGLPAPTQQRPPLQSEFVAPLNLRQEVIAECFRDILGIDNVGIHDNFFDLGGDSLSATELILNLSQTIGIWPSPEILLQEGSVFAIDQYLSADNRPDCIVRMQPVGELAPLFCMHEGSGHVLGYRRLARLLGPGRPVYGVQCCHTDSRLNGNVRLEDMARDYVKEIQNIQKSGPYFICGQCFGGLVAFEVARQLREQNERVALLALIDTAYPTGFIGQFVSRTRRAMRWIGESGYIGFEMLGFYLARLRGFPKWVGKELLIQSKSVKARLLSASRQTVESFYADSMMASRQIERRYRPKMYDGNVTLICPGAPHNQLGWRQVVAGDLQIVEIVIPGQSYHRPHLTTEPTVNQLAEILRKQINQAV